MVLVDGTVTVVWGMMVYSPPDGQVYVVEVMIEVVTPPVTLVVA